MLVRDPIYHNIVFVAIMLILSNVWGACKRKTNSVKIVDHNPLSRKWTIILGKYAGARFIIHCITTSGFVVIMLISSNVWGASIRKTNSVLGACRCGTLHVVTFQVG